MIFILVNRHMKCVNVLALVTHYRFDDNNQIYHIHHHACSITHVVYISKIQDSLDILKRKLLTSRNS